MKKKKPFRLYEYDNAKLIKPNRTIQHDHDSREEAYNTGVRWSNRRDNQVVLVHYTGTYESEILEVIG